MLKVSIIIPVYGVEKYIEKCARSIFEQSYSNLEIIFVNDCTKDDSIKVIHQTLDEYPCRKNQVQILSQEENMGVSAARKRGIESITGDYCIQFDSDDFVEQTMIEEMLNLAILESADIVFCDINLITKSSSRHIVVAPSLCPIECMEQLLRSQVHSSLCNKLIKTDLYRNNAIQFKEGLNMREDLSVMYRLMYFAKKISYISKPFYNYVLRGGSISDSRMSDMQQKNAQELIVQMNSFCVNEGIVDIDILDAFSYFKAQILTDIFLFGDNKALRSGLFEDVKFKHIFMHPKIAFTHKLMGIFVVLRITPLVWGYRKVLDFFLNK